MNSFHQSEKKYIYGPTGEKEDSLSLAFTRTCFFSPHPSAPPLEISSNEFPNAEVKEIDGQKYGLFQIKSMKKKE